MLIPRFRLTLFCAAATATLCAGMAQATPRELSDDELSDVRGQGLVTLSNTSSNGFDFSTITINANISLNANLQNVALGQYANGTDINIPVLQFGTSSGTTAQQTVQITDPYLEFVYSDSGGSGNRQVIGLRLGFDGISGNIGTLMSTISGSLQIADGTTGTLSSDAYRASTICAGATCMPLSQIGGLVAGNASGPSRDFWISFLSQAVQFPAQSGMAAPAVAQAGVWLNWTDRLSAANTSATIPANAFAALHH